MANFGRGLLSGFQVADSLATNAERRNALKEQQGWAKEDRARQAKELEALDAIRKSGAIAFDDVSMEAPQAPDAALPSMRAAAPAASIAPDGPVVTPVAAPGSGAPSMRPALPADADPATAARMAPPATGLQSNVGPDRAANIPSDPQAAPVAPPSAAAPPAPAMPKARTFSDMDRLNRSFTAMSQEAIKQGRPDLALQYHVEGLKLRDSSRTKAAEIARANYDTTGDINAFTAYVNNYVPFGGRIEAIEKDGEKFVIKGVSDTGKAFTQERTPDQMRRYIEFATDPTSAKALDAKKAEELYKAQLKLQELREQHRFQKAGPGDNIIDTSNGSMFTAPTEPKMNFGSIKNPDGSESGFFYDQYGMRGTVNPSGSSAAGVDVPKVVRDMQKDVTAYVFKSNGMDMLGQYSPDQQAKVDKQSTIANDLLTANYGTDTWSGLSAAKAATIAKGIAEGTIKVGEIPITATGKKVKGVVVDGQQYPLDPFEVRGALIKTPPEIKDAVKASGVSPAIEPIAASIYQQESSSGKADTSKPNYADARGPMQVTKDTFEGLKRIGRIPANFDWSNPKHTMIAAMRHLEDLYRDYGGDVKKIAAAYYSGPKSVTPGGIRAYRDPRNPRAPDTRQYADTVASRLG